MSLVTKCCCEIVARCNWVDLETVRKIFAIEEDPEMIVTLQREYEICRRLHVIKK